MHTARFCGSWFLGFWRGILCVLGLECLFWHEILWILSPPSLFYREICDRWQNYKILNMTTWIWQNNEIWQSCARKFRKILFNLQEAESCPVLLCRVVNVLTVRCCCVAWWMCWPCSLAARWHHQLQEPSRLCRPQEMLRLEHWRKMWMHLHPGLIQMRLEAINVRWNLSDRETDKRTKVAVGHCWGK